MNPAVQSISAFFPCYNDEATIGRMVDAAVKTIDECAVDGEVIVIDDGRRGRTSCCWLHRAPRRSLIHG
jgi:hypothetical protein